MKIALICDVLGKPNNGTTLATLNLMNYLKSQGHTVYVVSPDTSTEGKENYFVVPTLNLGALINKVVARNNVSLAKADKRILTSVISKADIVHLQLPFALSKGAVKIAKNLGKPITASFHCQAENFTAHIGAFNSRLINHLVYKNFYNKVYRYVDAVHYPTEFIRQVFYKHTHIEKPYYVISNGVNDDFFEKSQLPCKNGKFTIVCTGRYSKEKAQKVLIKAVAMSEYKDRIKIILAGDGPMKNVLARFARKKCVDCELRFFNRNELISVLHNADLYVHTAIVEIEAIACMEAIASGLVAVIADSERSATRLFSVDERTSFKYNSPADLCRKIEFFYENPDYITEYKDKFKNTSLPFRQENCMRQMEQMLKDVLEKGPNER